MGDESWDTSDFLKRYTTKAPQQNGFHNNGSIYGNNGNHNNTTMNHNGGMFHHNNNHNAMEMNTSMEGGDEMFSSAYMEDNPVFCSNNNIEERLVFLNQVRI